MTESEVVQLQQRISLLEKSNRKQRLFSCLLLLLFVGSVLCFAVRTSAVAASTTDKDGVMHVRGLVVEDTVGRERVRLGAPLPDPLIQNVRAKRQGTLSGILLTDATGTERSGYATEEHGEAFLTLDSQHGQEMTLLSNPDGGVNFDISDPHGNQAAITVFPSGPRFKMKKLSRAVVELPQPVNNENHNTR